MLLHNPFIAEFTGTLLLVFLTCVVVAFTKMHNKKLTISKWILMVAGFVLAIAVGVFTAKALGSPYADINPSITFVRFFVANHYNTHTMLILQAAQFLGAFTAGILTWFFYLFFYHKFKNAETILCVFTARPTGKKYLIHLIHEMIATFLLTTGIIIITNATRFFTANTTFLQLILFWLILCVYACLTGSALNPARDLGPRLAHTFLPFQYKNGSGWYYALIPFVGPYLGALLAAFLLRPYFV